MKRPYGRRNYKLTILIFMILNRGERDGFGKKIGKNKVALIPKKGIIG